MNILFTGIISTLGIFAVAIFATFFVLFRFPFYGATLLGAVSRIMPVQRAEMLFVLLLLLFQRRFLLLFSCLDVLLDLLSAGGSSNVDSRRLHKSWKLHRVPGVGSKF